MIRFVAKVWTEWVIPLFLLHSSKFHFQAAFFEVFPMSKIIDAVTALAVPIVQKHGCELWNVEYVKEAGNRYLRIFIDRPDGVSIDHCEAVSRDIDPILDNHDNLIPESYIFEVSSAGVERRLRGPSDFDRFAGHFVEIKLYKSKDGKKSFLGNLAAWSEDCVVLDISGDRHSFAGIEVAGVWLRIS